MYGANSRLKYPGSKTPTRRAISCIGRSLSVQHRARLGHSAFDDPLLHGAPGAATHDGGQVPGRHPHFLRHVAQRQWLAVPAVDHRKDFGEQRFAAAPQIVHDVAGQPRDIDQQQREVRQRGLLVAVLTRGQFRFDRLDRGIPVRLAGFRQLQSQQPARLSVQKREQ